MAVLAYKHCVQNLVSRASDTVSEVYTLQIRLGCLGFI